MGTWGIGRTLASGLVAVLATWTISAPAVAEPSRAGDEQRGQQQTQTGMPPADQGRGDHGKAPAPGQGKKLGHAKGAPHGQGKALGHTKGKDQGKDQGEDDGQGKAKGGPTGSGAARPPAPPQGRGPAKAPAQGAPEQGTRQPAQGSAGDPPGNNGTVKIAPLGEIDGIPDNTAHPGCTFQVEWYGFDEGPDVVSTVSFEMKAPTADVTLSVDGPARVPVGEDPASGAGTATGLDAVATYALSFSGAAAHAQQGYHVRLTVSTPRSLGADTKTKVFWVEACVADPSSGGDPITPDTTDRPGGATSQSDPSTEAGTMIAGTGTTTATEVTSTGPSGGLLQLRSASTVAEAGRLVAPVPTVIDAGLAAAGVGERERPLLALALAAWGVVLAGAGLLLRRRRT